MNIIDREFHQLTGELRRLSEKEIYHRMRNAFDLIPASTKRSCADFFASYNYWGKLDADNDIYEEIEMKAETLHDHTDDFIWLYGRLADFRSKKTLYAILNNWYRYDLTSTTQAREYMFDDYFDLDIVKCGKNEVIADLGAFTGDTILSYINNYGDNYRKIYCYEITPDVFEMLKTNLKGLRDIHFRMKGIGDRPGKMSLSTNDASSSANRLASAAGTDEDQGSHCDFDTDIIVTTLDEDISEPLTLIKADIEGFEQKALLGARRHIAEDHPKLLISVYHSNEDLWKIPKMIDEIAEGYDFYLRFKGSPIYPTEITLIAV